MTAPRDPIEAPATECEHRNASSLRNWIPDGKGGNVPDGKGYHLYCADCKTTFKPEAAARDEGRREAVREAHRICHGVTCPGNDHDKVCGPHWRNALLAGLNASESPPTLGMHDGDHECRLCGLTFPVGDASEPGQPPDES